MYQIDVKQGVLYRIGGTQVKKYLLTPNEKRLISLLANNKYIVYEEINRFVYKNELTEKEIIDNVNNLHKQFGMHIQTTKRRARIQDAVAIR